MRQLQTFVFASLFPWLSAATASDWHAPDWPYRAIVDVTEPGSGGIDVAVVRIFHSGAAAPGGNDYRIFDAAGRPVPYQIVYHHDGRDTLLIFRCDKPASGFAVYYGRPGVPPDPMRAIDPAVPGGGPPRPGPAAEGWVPRAGLVLTTMRRPRAAANPRSIEQFTELIEQSAGLDGGGLCTNIRDGLNRYGDSDHFISIYRGWINLPAAGRYGFCTASNEASFSFIDGRRLVHWPGRHTEQRGRLGEKNAVHQFTAGLHYIEYYHEEVLLYQVAFLGYRPPGAPHYIGIPDALFPQPTTGQVVRYEMSGGRRAIALRPDLLDSIWPKQRDEGQYTRYQFVADAGAKGESAADWEVDWTFGDGQSARGVRVEHVYLKIGTYDVRMTAAGPDGQRIEQSWPLVAFPVEHLDGPFTQGDVAAYLPIVAGYDPDKLATSHLAELARLCDEAGDRKTAGRAARAVVKRPDAETGDLADTYLIVADASDANSSEHLNAALEHETDPVKRIRIITRLIQLVGVERGDPESAERLYDQATALLGGRPPHAKLKQAYRAASIAAGDARLNSRRFDEAHQVYRLAESLADPPVPMQVRNARIGAYHEAITQHLRDDRLDAAMTVAQQWRRSFPSDQRRGEVLYWIGKIEQLRSRPRQAVAPLQLAIELAQGAEFEAEARWLLAESFRGASEPDRARAELKALVKTGLAGAFREKAMEALAASP